MGKDAVNLKTPDVFLALLTFDDCLGTDPFNKRIAHIRQSGVTIHLTVLFHLHNTVFHQIQFIIGKFQSLYDVLVTLYNLGCRKPGRHTDSLRMILHLMADRMNTAVHRALLTKVRHLGINSFGRNLLDSGNQIFNALIFHRTDGNHRDTQRLLHFGNVNRSAVSPHFIHHIKRQHHRNMQFQELEGKIQISFNIGGIHDIDDSVRFLL